MESKQKKPYQIRLE